MSELTDVWEDRRVNIGYETAEELAKHYNLMNWRGHPEAQRDATEDSLDALGYVGAIKKSVQSGVILDGHLRIEIALAKDPSIQLPVDYYDLSPDEEALALQVLDATTEMAEPIPDKLAELLERTREMTADRPGLGAMLERLKERAGINGNGHSDNGNEPPMPTETEAERLAKQYETAPGQVWQLGRHIIACVDSTDEAAVKELIGGKPVGFVWADPPYSIGAVDEKTGQTGGLGRPGGGYPFGGAKNDGRSKPILSNVYAPVIGDTTTETAIKSSGLCLGLFEKAAQTWWGANNYADNLPPSTGWIVWDKDNGDNAFADCELAWTNQKRAARIFKHRWNGMLKASEQGERRVHPTQKPIVLAEEVFSEYGKPESIIFDPFLGSGISVLAAEKLNDGRRVIGCELAHEYIAVTIHRWSQLTGQTPRRLSS